MQRVRIGLTGLAIVFLLVLLTTALFGVVSRERAIRTDAEGNVVAAPAPAENAQIPKEPLAELGVAPGHSAAETAPDNAGVPTAPVAGPARAKSR